MSTFHMVSDDLKAQIEQLEKEKNIISDNLAAMDALFRGYLTMVIRREGVTLCQYNGGDLTEEQCAMIEKIADHLKSTDRYL